MLQLKINEKSSYGKTLKEHQSVSIILSSAELDGAITVYFDIINKNSLNYTIGYGCNDYDVFVDEVVNFKDKAETVKTIITHITIKLSDLGIVLQDKYINIFSESISMLIDKCEQMNGIHVNDYQHYLTDASFTILENDEHLHNYDYYKVKIFNHNWEYEKY